MNNPKSLFISHNCKDKLFVRKLASDLQRCGVRCWLDEAEIQVGDSLISKIRDAIDEMDYVGVVLSPNSVDSPWVQREVDIAMNQEIEGRRVKVLPLLYCECELPSFLKGKLYADFSSTEKYESALTLLLRRLDVTKAEFEPANSDTDTLEEMKVRRQLTSTETDEEVFIGQGRKDSASSTVITEQNRSKDISHVDELAAQESERTEPDNQISTETSVRDVKTASSLQNSKTSNFATPTDIGRSRCSACHGSGWRYVGGGVSGICDRCGGTGRI